jgi:hypothetical protein
VVTFFVGSEGIPSSSIPSEEGLRVNFGVSIRGLTGLEESYNLSLDLAGKEGIESCVARGAFLN